MMRASMILTPSAYTNTGLRLILLYLFDWYVKLNLNRFFVDLDPLGSFSLHRSN